MWNPPDPTDRIPEPNDADDWQLTAGPDLTGAPVYEELPY